MTHHRQRGTWRRVWRLILFAVVFGALLSYLLRLPLNTHDESRDGHPSPPGTPFADVRPSVRPTTL